MTIKILFSVLAVSAASVLPVAAEQSNTAPSLGLPTTVSSQGAELPATNLLFVGGAFVAAVGILAGAEGDGSDEATTTTPSTTSE